ncbi:tRNA (pseudouridine(54)-N(1))-methyltransferase TrmY [Thermococcus peptonophilus]|uniref:tRNA (pseudouridine(54)-N(1))-methyltransferase n=1 Tax=Thermococcus peptonophilus TaxID=53952 RepID=A0A142CTB5_9EURY|nr:tRNA (pseudouridine(54)-N(1))-methyltransferase TrmY [Thermococcus peptonophilus]AMQ18017.1 tRNA (pseudouridine-N1)-methyltransferase [Thermococcus peptonophilus]
MRTFILKANTAITSPDFSLKDLPGTGGRIDLLCRFLNSAFLLSHGIRKDVRVFITLYGKPNPPKTIHFEGPKLKVRLNPDERSTSLILKKALEVGKDLREPTKEVEVFPGVYVSNMTFEDVVRRSMKDSTLYYLVEDGRPITEIEFPQNPAFVLGDHLGLGKEDERFLEGIAEKVRVGRRSYLASHVVAFVNIWLDGM